MAAAIDLNADLGESYGAWRMGDDEAVLDVVTSANVACGFHGGSPQVMAATTRAAAGRGVVIGAHVSYPDLVGFGRREMNVAPDELADDLVYQLGALEGMARAAGSRVRYVKPHGALYHRVASDPEAAEALVAAMAGFDPDLVLVTLPGSVAASAAQKQGLAVAAEAFADRAYHPDGGLVSRSQPGSVLHDPGEVVTRAVRLATEGTVVAADGSVIAVVADSLCLHGDTAGAAGLSRAVRDGLVAAGVAVRPFVEAAA